MNLSISYLAVIFFLNQSPKPKNNRLRGIHKEAIFFCSIVFNLFLDWGNSRPHFDLCFDQRSWTTTIRKRPVLFKHFIIMFSIIPRSFFPRMRVQAKQSKRKTDIIKLYLESTWVRKRKWKEINKTRGRNKQKNTYNQSNNFKSYIT